MRRHKPGTIIWTLDRLACLYQSWKERFGDLTPKEVHRAERLQFEQDWSAWMTKRTGGGVSPKAINHQLRFGFTMQRTVSRNHFWAYVCNRAARLHVGVKVGPKHDYSWPQKLTVGYARRKK